MEKLTKEEYDYLYNFNWNSGSIDHNVQRELLVIYNRVYHENKQMSSCSFCIAEMIVKLRTKYNEYYETEIKNNKKK